MDPARALRDAVDAAEQGDALSALDYLTTLLGWISRGGFLPRKMEAQIDRLTVAIARLEMEATP
jgi:hypothetical protein